MMEIRPSKYALIAVIAIVTSLLVVGVALAQPAGQDGRVATRTSAVVRPRQPSTYHTPMPTPSPTPMPTATATPDPGSGNTSTGASSGTSSGAAPAPVSAANIGIVMLNTAQAQPVYTTPGGELVRVDGQEVWLPNDADGSGFDTYVVMDMTLVDGEVWVGLFLGSANPGWVMLDGVTPVTYLGEDALFDDE